MSEEYGVRNCPLCGKYGNYTEYNFCMKCFNRLKRLFSHIVFAEMASGLAYMAELASRKEDEEE